MNNILKLLEGIRGIAQNGLNYSKNEYDIQRYTQLLNLCCHEYSNILPLQSDELEKIFLKEIGHTTPKVGVNAAVIQEGKLLIAKRKDDGCWELPGGWAELGETPQQTIERELLEETEFIVKARKVIDVVSRLPGEFNQPFTSYHILYHCEFIGGVFKASNETSEINFINNGELDKVEWHRDHKILANRVFEWINK